MTIDPNELERLSKAATQGVWEISAYYTGTGPDEKCCGLVEVEDFPIGIIDEEGATAESLSPNLEFVTTLVNAYRTGQLVPAQPSVKITERQSETLHKALLASYDSMVPPMPSGDEVEAAWEALKARCCADPANAKKCVMVSKDDFIAAITAYEAVSGVTRKFNLGDRVTKTKGSSWTGLVVGFYSTSLTPIGYAVESENEPGSVQIYPESALEACLKARENGDG